MKKFISILLVCIMTCGLIAGCSESGGQTETNDNETQQ